MTILVFLFLSALTFTINAQSESSLIGTWELLPDEGKDLCENDVKIELNANRTASIITGGSDMAKCRENRDEFSKWKYEIVEGEKEVISHQERAQQRADWKKKQAQYAAEDAERKEKKADRKEKKKNKVKKEKKGFLKTMTSTADRLSSVSERTTSKLDRFDEKTTVYKDNSKKILGLKGDMDETYFQILEFDDQLMKVKAEVRTLDSTSSKVLTFSRIR